MVGWLFQSSILTDFSHLCVLKLVYGAVCACIGRNQCRIELIYATKQAHVLQENIHELKRKENKVQIMKEEINS